MEHEQQRGAPSRAFAESVYEKLTDDEDARACRDIAEEACRETPRSFLMILAGNFLAKLGDEHAKTVLPWLMSAVGAPLALVALLVPLRESGSLLPQLAIAGYIRTLPLRKWVWVAGSIAQAATIGAVALAAATLTGAVAGWTIVGLVALFSLARGFCSVASKDVLGKTVPKKKRGQLNGWSASAAGLVTVAVGAALMAGTRDDDLPYVAMLAGGAALWVAAALAFAAIREFPGETGGGASALRHAWKSLGLLRSDAAFRRFVLVRALFISSALSAPYYVVLAESNGNGGPLLLGLFVAVSGLSSLLSGPFWGRFADRSSRGTLLLAAAIASLASLTVFAASRLAPALLAELWFLPLAYFVLSIGHNGIRVGRKTYVVDLAGGNRRTDYVAVSNSAIGVILLAAGLAAAALSGIGVDALILLFALAGLLGIALGRSMKETQ
jgi:MFS family permease